MTDSTRDLQKLFLILLVDLTEAEKRVATSDAAISRRDYIRTFLAVVEGMNFGLKQSALRWAKLKNISILSEDAALLREKSYEMTDSGKARIGRKFLRTAPNTRFAINSFAKLLNIEYILDLEDSGWSSFKTAVEIRNRITHPKTLSDLEISDDDLSTVYEGAVWYRKALIALFELANATVFDKSA